MKSTLPPWSKDDSRRVYVDDLKRYLKTEVTLSELRDFAADELTTPVFRQAATELTKELSS